MRKIGRQSESKSCGSWQVKEGLDGRLDFVALDRVGMGIERNSGTR